MRLINAMDDSASVTLVSAVTATQDPLAGSALVAVPSGWQGSKEIGQIAELDFHMWASGTGTFTNVELYAMVPEIGIIADTTFTAANATEIFTANAHGLLTGDGPINVSNSGGALPAGLTAATDYWIIRLSANTFQLATTFARALAGTPVVAITTDGTGTQTLADVATTKLVRWTSPGVLTASIALTIRKAYKVRVPHHPLAQAYAVALTHPGTIAVSVKVVPVAER